MTEQIWEVAEPDPQHVRNIMEAVPLSRPTAVLLAHLGLAPDQVRGFLQPSLKDLVDPYALPGARKAAERMWEAVHRGEEILIHGDYDTDGITAATLLQWVLRHNGARAEAFLPHRIDDGYGLTPESLEKASCHRHALLITVDCGITSHDAVRAASEAGLDVIITDHHQPSDTLPDALCVIDPKLPGAPEPLRELAGVGVAFKVCHAFMKYGLERGFGGLDLDLKDGLDLVALGTVADIVPLLQENRTLVRHGLRVLSRQQRPGVRALCEMARIGDTVHAPDVAFRIAPRLNAAGRLGNPAASMDLLRASSMEEATRLAQELDNRNKERQHLEEIVLRAAEEQIREYVNLSTDRTVVVWGEEWHQGVIGIVASRLARRYHRPALVLTRESNGSLCGSGRSIRRVDLVSVLEKCSHCLERFGGHPMAAGLSLTARNLLGFRESFERAVREVLTIEAMRPQLEIVAEVGFDEINERFLTELDMLEPFGHSNPEPVFLAKYVHPQYVTTAGKSHARGSLCDAGGTSLDFIAFGRRPEDLPQPPWNLAYTPQMNRYGGRARPQARVVDIRSA